jgi:hypothetical protein
MTAAAPPDHSFVFPVSEKPFVHSHFPCYNPLRPLY